MGRSGHRCGIQHPLTNAGLRKRDADGHLSKREVIKIGNAEELELASLLRDGTLRDAVTMWVVRDGDELYVRSMHGRSGGWFRVTQTRYSDASRRPRPGRRVDKDVSFVVEPDSGVNDRLDAAYRGKYRRYGESIVGGAVNPASRASTIRHFPTG